MASPALQEKIAWAGYIISVQPRIRLLRSFDQRHHSYQGYVLRVKGAMGSDVREFMIAVGQGAHGKFHFQTGMSHTEEDWVDEEATSHREPDE